MIYTSSNEKRNENVINDKQIQKRSAKRVVFLKLNFENDRIFSQRNNSYKIKNNFIYIYNFIVSCFIFLGHSLELRNR
jgi:hypothetical protein